MTLILINSSAIRAVGYDGYTLTVEFRAGAHITTATSAGVTAEKL